MAIIKIKYDCNNQKIMRVFKNVITKYYSLEKANNIMKMTDAKVNRGILASKK